MKTVQIMERPFYDGIVRQNHKSGWFCATDLVKIGNKYRNSIDLGTISITSYFRQKTTKEFIEKIMDEERVSKVRVTKRGKGGETWVHPLIMIDIAMWLNPKFKYEALSWLKDRLIQNRDMSGDSYKSMCGALDKGYNLGARMGLVIPKIARRIKESCGVEDWNNATETQLSKRDRIHLVIMSLSKHSVPIDDMIKTALEVE